MKKILVTASAALLATLAIAATTVPASAGGSFNFNIGVGGWGPGWGPGYGGIYVGSPYPVYNDNWEAHVDWCYDHKGPSYNPNTNKYINMAGKKRTCHSPFA